MSPELVLPENGKGKDITTPEAAEYGEFNEYCDTVWNRLCEHCEHSFFDLDRHKRVDRETRSKQAVNTAVQLEDLLRKHRQGVEDLLSKAG